MNYVAKHQLLVGHLTTNIASICTLIHNDSGFLAAVAFAIGSIGKANVTMSRVANRPIFPGRDVPAFGYCVPRPGNGRPGTYNVPFQQDFIETVKAMQKCYEIKETRAAAF